MASRDAITEDLLIESGRQGTAARRKIDQKVGDVTLELLQQNEGRFRALEKTQTISVVVSTTLAGRQYKLDSKFNTAKDTMYEQDLVTGDFKNKITILTEAEVFERLSNAGPTSSLMGYIKYLTSHSSGRGQYLVLSQNPTETKSYIFQYYRAPTPDDTDVIRKTSIIKHGVRGSLPEYFEDSDLELKIYFSMLGGFRESPERFVTDLIMTPPPRIALHNQKMHDISQGG